MDLTVKLADQVDVDRVNGVLKGLSAPAPKSKIIEWLTICAVKTGHAKQDDMSSELKLKVYADDLSKFPGDIVRHVLAEWPSKSSWFPHWKELEDEIASLSGIRPQIISRVSARIQEARS